MKKPFKIITIFILILFTCFGIGICAIPDNSFAKEKGDIGFEDFSTRLCAMIEEYQEEYIRQETSFDLEGDLIKRNNVLMVNGETFKEMTGSYISKEDGKYVIEKENKKVQLSPDSNFVLADESDSCLRTPVEIENGDILFPIEEISNSLEYELKFDNDKVTLNRPYGTKRVIVGSREKIDDCNAIASVECYKGLHIFQYATEEDTIKACEYFSKLTNIDYYQVDGIVRATETTDNVTITGLGDSFSYTTWGASVMGVQSYSEYLKNTIGISNLPQLVVAVLDTGIDVNHSWFNGRIAEGGKNFSSSNSDDPDNYQDVKGHGTHVSGTICDLTLNNVKILPVKILNDSGKGSDSQIIAGIYHVAELKQNGLNICAINMSLGGEDYIGSYWYNAYKAAMQTALDVGVLSVVSAGNEGEDAKNYGPANIDIALTVASVGRNGLALIRANSSNYGDLVDVCAPGVNIVSAKVGGGTVSKSGTSMAAPHVAAAVALLMSDSNKNYNINQIESIIEENTLDLGDPGFDVYYGEGLVNFEYIMNSIYYNIKATAGANGSISPSGNFYVKEGNSQTFTFTPNEKYYVSAILIDNIALTGNELQNAITNGYTFNNVTAEHSISVEFTINTYNIVATAGANGSISPSGNITVNEGNSQTFTFTPNKMYHVSSITVDNNPLTGNELQNAITNGYTFNNVTAEHSISVTFAVNTYTLTIENSEHGEIRVSDETVKHNGSVTITFIPEYHYRLKEAMIDGKVIVLENGTAEYKLNQVTSSHTIKASFVEDLYSVSIKSDSNYGNVSYSQQSSEIYGGEARTFTITPIEGYEVDKVLVNGEIVEVKNNTFTVEKISSDIDLEVTYKKSTPPTTNAVWGVVIGVVAVVMISSAVFVFVKKRKKKAAL